MKKLGIGFLSALLIIGVAGFTNAATIYTDGDLGTHTTDAVAINLNGLAAHSEITVNFDLYILDSWDGNTSVGGTIPPDYFAIQVDGTTNSWTFDNFYYADETNTDTADGVGNYNSINAWGPIDRYFNNYNNGFTFAHTSDTLSLLFFGYGNGFQSIYDESWRVTNLMVSANDRAPVPEPASLFLLGSGIVGFVGSRLRKKK